MALSVLMTERESRASTFLANAKPEILDVGDDSQTIFAIGLDGNLYVKGGRGRWIDRGAPSGTTLVPAWGVSGVGYLDNFATIVEWGVYAVAADGHLYEFRFDGLYRCGSAYCWTDLGDCGGGYCNGPVQAVVQRDLFTGFTYVRVFATGGGVLYEKRRRVSDVAWWTSDRGSPAGQNISASTPIGAAVDSSEQLDLFVRCNDGLVYRRTFPGIAPSGDWSALPAPGGGTTLNASSLVATYSGNTLYIYARGSGGPSDWDGEVLRSAPLSGGAWVSLNSGSFDVATSTASIDAIGTTVFAASSGGNNLYVRSGGVWTYHSQPGDTSTGLLGSVQGLFESYAGTGYLAYATAEMQPAGGSAIRYLYERRITAARWLNHASPRHGPGTGSAFEQQPALSEWYLGTGEPVLGEHYGRLIAAARWRDYADCSCDAIQSRIMTARSTDDGMSWSDGPALPGGGDLYSSWEMMRDPWIAFTSTGTGYLAFLAINLDDLTCARNRSAVLVYRTMDYGASYTPCTVVDDWGDLSLDGASVAWDSTRNRLYVAYWDRSAAETVHVRYLASGTACTSPSPWTEVTSVANCDGGYPGMYADPAGNLYVHCMNAGAPDIRKSTNAGASWTSLGPVDPSATGELSLDDPNQDTCGHSGNTMSDMNATPGAAVSSTNSGTLGIARISDPPNDPNGQNAYYSHLLPGMGDWANGGPYGSTTGEQFGASTELVNDVVSGQLATRAFLTYYSKGTLGSFPSYSLRIILLTLPSDGPATWPYEKTFTTIDSQATDLMVEESTRFLGEYRATAGGRGLHHHPVWIDTRYCEATQGGCGDGDVDAQLYTSFATPVYW